MSRRLIHNWRVLFSLVGFVIASLQNSAIVPVSRQDADWMNRHNAMVAVGQKGESQIVFIGDSITHAFGGDPDTGEDFHNRGKDTWDLYYGADKPLNLGISGDQTQYFLWRLKQGQSNDMPLTAVSLMIGTNNAFLNTPDQIRDGIQAIVNMIRIQKPKAKILLLGIFPRGEKPDDAGRLKVIEINKLLVALGQQRNVTFMDIGSKFLQPDGTISREVMGDFLHPTDKGYQIWADAVEPWMQANAK